MSTDNNPDEILKNVRSHPLVPRVGLQQMSDALEPIRALEQNMKHWAPFKNQLAELDLSIRVSDEVTKSIKDTQDNLRLIMESFASKTNIQELCNNIAERMSECCKIDGSLLDLQKSISDNVAPLLSQKLKNSFYTIHNFGELNFDTLNSVNAYVNELVNLPELTAMRIKANLLAEQIAEIPDTQTFGCIDNDNAPKNIETDEMPLESAIDVHELPDKIFPAFSYSLFTAVNLINRHIPLTLRNCYMIRYTFYAALITTNANMISFQTI